MFFKPIPGMNLSAQLLGFTPSSPEKQHLFQIRASVLRFVGVDSANVTHAHLSCPCLAQSHLPVGKKIQQ